MAPWTRRLGCVLACYAPIGRGERESGRENGRREEERRKRERGDGKRLKESWGERESEARLEWRKRAESGNWSEKDDERRWR
ncbi:hypothetical protein TNCV_5064771 [Trichonephila clavipes]|nr:hypothetical protein TNCV_5064771 [Trichonephila clavipes]